MSDPRDLLDEYVDGLLEETVRAEVDAALARDPALRVELARARRFATLLGDLSDLREIRRVVKSVRPARRGRRLLWAAVATLATAATLLLALRGGRAPDPIDTIAADWATFGERLGQIALERREGRVPRTGIGDLEAPPAKAQGFVYRRALAVLGVTLDAAGGARAERLIADHYEAMRRLGDDLVSECARAEAALALYRTLRREAGADAADAWYDLFRPALADLRTARRIPAAALSEVAGNDGYIVAYEEAMHLLERRYGAERLAVVLDRLAPHDRRFYRRDATDDGIGRDAVLAIRAGLYRAAADAGVARLFVVG